jgi:hypothetical protein
MGSIAVIDRVEKSKLLVKAAPQEIVIYGDGSFAHDLMAERGQRTYRHSGFRLWGLVGGLQRGTLSSAQW